MTTANFMTTRVNNRTKGVLQQLTQGAFTTRQLANLTGFTTSDIEYVLRRLRKEGKVTSYKTKGKVAYSLINSNRTTATNSSSASRRDAEALLHLEKRSSLTLTQLATAMNMSDGGASHIINRLFLNKEVDRSGAGRAGNPYRYCLVPSLGINADNTSRTSSTKAPQVTIKTKSIKSNEVPVDNTLALGAAALLLRVIDRKGKAVLTADSPVVQMIQNSVDTHLDG